MKRYRVFSGDFDTRALALTNDVMADWDIEVKDRNRKNQFSVISGLLTEFGTANSEFKLQNLIDLGSSPISIIAFHNSFLRQIRGAFVIGAYYPALTGACALGERVLNHLMRNLREYYRGTPEYRHVYDKDSFDDWALPIKTLATWNVLLPSIVADFESLAVVRNRKAIHFNPDTDQNDRAYALEAIKLLSQIISEQFSSFGNQSWFIPNTPGCSFIKKDAESSPFIQAIYIGLENCLLVGPYHKVTDIVHTPRGLEFRVNDEYNYEQREISDDEFAEMYNANRGLANKIPHG